MDIQKVSTEIDELQIAAHALDCQIDALKAEIADGYFDDEKLEELVAKSMKLGELYAQRDAKAQAVPEGFVLVEKSKVKTWYQDQDEPENWANNIDELDILGDGIDEDEFIWVDQISDAIIQKIKKVGVWKVEMIDQWGDVHRNFVLVDSREDAEKIIESNKFIHTQYKAQEQKG